MKTFIQNINKDLFGRALNWSLIELNNRYPDSKLINAIKTLCEIPLEEFNKNNYSDEILDDSSELEKCQNKEVLARWNEYLFKKGRNDKQIHLRKAVSLYLDIFQLTSNNKYLIHALQIVKMTKGIFKDKLPEIYKQGKNVILDLDLPFVQKEILIELISILPEKAKLDFEEFFYDRINVHSSEHDYSGVVFLVESLKTLKVLDNTEYKIMLAENYEKEGDFQLEGKQSNTFYPNILIKYQNGLRELKGIKCPIALRKRLEKKVIAEQKERLKMHSAIARSFNNESKLTDKIINEFGDSCLKHLGINDFFTGYNNLLSFPIYLFENTKQFPKYKFLYPIFLPTHHRFDSKGKVVGETTCENNYRIQNRNIFRECTINFLKKTKWIMDEDKIINRDMVYNLLFDKCKSNFIPEDRKWLFAKGINAGFSNDFITASHILIPQIENSLKYIVKKNGLLSAKLYDDIQQDNMLGGLLESLIKVNGHDLFFELKDFLIENSDVNFRNELCHGLLAPFQISHYGIYVWWICLKMIYDKEKIF